MLGNCKMTKHVTIKNITVGNDLPIVFICGPCQIESCEHALETAARIKYIGETLNVGMIYKSSFDKANRTSIHGQRGVGISRGLDILARVSEKYDMPVLTDVHSAEQCSVAAQYVDILQIPAFLCRQTDLLIAAAKTNKTVNVKKAQFLAPWDMIHVAEKISSTGNDNIMLCERGTCFGYNNLVSDMRSLSIMSDIGYPVVFDATHSVQQPGGNGSSSGGQREFVDVLARAATAVGVAAVFIETHENPDCAPSDGANMIALDDLTGLISRLVEFDRVLKRY
jgi:2-dehydro-3-deoxyphosphooctonate aldolase (KDO 8-P synthase)